MVSHCKKDTSVRKIFKKFLHFFLIRVQMKQSNPGDQRNFRVTHQEDDSRAVRSERLNELSPFFLCRSRDLTKG